MMDDAVVAIDIGGTKTAAALVGRDLAILRTREAPTPGAAGSAAIIDVAARLAVEVLGPSPRPPGAIGVGTAGVVDVGSGTILSSTDTLASWAGTRIPDRLRDALPAPLRDVPIHVQNDVDAHAVGEMRVGAARGARSALVVAVGTGIGAAIVVDGEIVRGHRSVAGEIAHAPIAGADHLRCPCGRTGHLEALGSGVGMLRHFWSLGGDVDVASARELAGHAAAMPLAMRAIVESSDAVGRGLAAAVTLLDPEIVVLSGGVLKMGPSWWDPMERTLRAALIDVLQDVPVVRGALGDHAPLVGAAASAWGMLREDR